MFGGFLNTWVKNWQETAGAQGWSAELHFFLTEGVQEWSKPVSESPKCKHIPKYIRYAPVF